ncbi:MAG TPA: NAD(P)-dependent oxidoreductase [Terriglobales bacterium]|nr:NAD(P)-dependent oxidoreductase [Terriglobales bacterium]
MKVAFLGLGVMGYPMAGHLARAGHEVTVYNRTAAKAAQWHAEYGGAVAASPDAAASAAEIVFACVGKDEDAREVTTGPHGAFASLAAGAIFVDHTTTSAHLARELELAARARGAAFLDAPVSGGQVGAANGTLTVMVGGDNAAYATAEPVMRSYARMVKRMGPSGSGQLTKMVNQICIAGLVQSLAEAIRFAEHAGLDPSAAIEVISKGAAQSWQMENRHRPMIEGKFDFGFAVDWMRKDLAIVLEEARRNGATLPIAALVDQFYAEVQAQGGGRWDTSSLITRLR